MEYIESQPLELAIVLFAFIAGGLALLRSSDGARLFGASTLLAIIFYVTG